MGTTIFAFGLQVCSKVIGAVTGSLYIVDAHSELDSGLFASAVADTA